MIILGFIGLGIHPILDPYGTLRELGQGAEVSELLEVRQARGSFCERFRV